MSVDFQLFAVVSKQTYFLYYYKIVETCATQAQICKIIARLCFRRMHLISARARCSPPTRSGSGLPSTSPSSTTKSSTVQTRPVSSRSRLVFVLSSNCRTIDLLIAIINRCTLIFNFFFLLKLLFIISTNNPYNILYLHDCYSQVRVIYRTYYGIGKNWILLYNWVLRLFNIYDFYIQVNRTNCALRYIGFFL